LGAKIEDNDLSHPQILAKQRKIVNAVKNRGTSIKLATQVAIKTTTKPDIRGCLVCCRTWQLPRLVSCIKFFAGLDTRGLTAANQGCPPAVRCIAVLAASN
jgi:hypothetical protein